MEYSYTQNDSIWNSEDYSYTIIDGTNTYATSAISYIQEEHYIQNDYQQEYEYKQQYIQPEKYIQDDFWKKYFNGDWENKDDRLVEILKIILEEYENKLLGDLDEIHSQEKINLIKEALEIAVKKTTYDFDFKPIKPEAKKPSYLEDDLFEI